MVRNKNAPNLALVIFLSVLGRSVSLHEAPQFLLRRSSTSTHNVVKQRPVSGKITGPQALISKRSEHLQQQDR